MARASRAAALGIAVLLLCGCSTVANISTGARQGWKNAYIYGGVRRDIQSEANWIDHSWTWGKNLDVIQDIGSAVGIVLVGVDVPLSAVGDTLTLPITVPIAIWSNTINRDSARRQAAPAPPGAIADPAANAVYPAANAAGSPYSANAVYPAANAAGTPYSTNQQR